MSATMSLDDLIAALEKQPVNNRVGFWFTDSNPRCLISYRGFYHELSIDFDESAPPKTVYLLLKECREAIGKEFEGYKGGDYTMHGSTAVWAEQYSEAGERALLAVYEDGDVTRLVTSQDLPRLLAQISGPAE